MIELVLELVLLFFLDPLLVLPDEVVVELSPPDTLEPGPELEVPELSLAELLPASRVTITATMTPMTAMTTTTAVS